MKESQFGFEYSWEDMRPIRPLVVTAFAVQIVGALFGIALSKYPSWFVNLWAGGALMTFPGFLLGLLVQWRINAERISEHRVMIRRVGLIALILTLSVFVMPLENFVH
ncbi:MAG: hypothetical protein ACJ8LN_10075 [Sulfurifustis sp.]